MTYITMHATNMKFKYVHFRANIQRLNSGKSELITRTQREVLASTVLEVGNIYVREIGSGWKADEKYSLLRLSLLGGRVFFSPCCKAKHIHVCVHYCPPFSPQLFLSQSG